MRTWWLAIALALAAAGVHAEAQKSTVKTGKAPVAAKKGPAVNTDDDAVLRAGSFSWAPERSPSGPVVLVVSLPEQRMHVYRNGVRIAVSTVSTGTKGRETPPGSYEILQKKVMHHSNLYDDAPMPFMQRITWDGLALHAGRLPGYPASHGCVRLPHAFAEKLYSVTKVGARVVISEDSGLGDLDNLVHPGPEAPVDALTGLPILEASPGVDPAQLVAKADAAKAKTKAAAKAAAERESSSQAVVPPASNAKAAAKPATTDVDAAANAAAAAAGTTRQPEPLPTAPQDPAMQVQKPVPAPQTAPPVPATKPNESAIQG